MTDSSPEWLFVLNAASAQVEGDQLTLEGLHPVSVAFTDRPARRVQRFVTEKFLESWAETFAGDPPNAALSWWGDAGEATAVVELGNPAVFPGGATMTFRLLPTEEGVDGLAMGAEEAPAGTLEVVTLFVDRSSLSIDEQAMPLPDSF